MGDAGNNARGTSLLSEAALERCKLVRTTLLGGALTRAELKVATKMSSNDLRSALIRCANAHMTVMVKPQNENEKAKFALTGFGYRIAVKELEGES